MIRATNIKLARDLWRQRVQCMAIALIVACGVASQVTSFSLIVSLKGAMDNYYDTSRFADLFVRVLDRPIAEAEKCRSISGVSAIQPRLVLESPLRVSKEPDDPATATVIGVPDQFLQNANRLVTKRGLSLQKLDSHQVVISEVFAEARGLNVGDSIELTIDGKWIPVEVSGIAISPEYLFQIREGDGIPDNRRFAIVWMPYEELAQASNRPNTFNSLCLRLTSSAWPDSVEEQVKQTLKPRNVLSTQDRSRQISHRYTNNAIQQLYSVAIVPPTLFFLVSAFLIYIAISRLMRTERENIAMQRAFGYGPLAIATHYFAYILIVVAVGCVIGLIVGMLFAAQATSMYQQIYRFPQLPVRLSIWALLLSVVISSLIGLLDGGHAIWTVASLPPAIGLRPEPPASYRLTWMDRLAELFRLSPLAHMVVRGLQRWKLRTGLGVLGIALGMGVMILGRYTQGAVAYVIDFEFFKTRRYDVMVQFLPGTSSQAIEEIRRMNGVLGCEPIEAGQCTVRNGHLERSITVIGVESIGELLVPVSEQHSRVLFERRGIAISKTLAEALQISQGGSLELVLQDGLNYAVDVPVTDLVSDFSGLNAYVNLADYQRWFRREAICSGALLQIASDRIQTVNQALNRCPRVHGVTIKSSALENFQSNDSKNLLLFRIFNMIFSGVIGIGAVYSIASISLVERQKDMALMRVLGYTPWETGFVLMGEISVMMALAIPLGCISGYAFSAIATWMLNSETQRIPLLITFDTYASAVFVSLIAFVISCLLIQRMVHKLDCVSLLKSKD